MSCTLCVHSPTKKPPCLKAKIQPSKRFGVILFTPPCLKAKIYPKLYCFSYKNIRVVYVMCTLANKKAALSKGKNTAFKAFWRNLFHAPNLKTKIYPKPYCFSYKNIRVVYVMCTLTRQQKSRLV